MSENKSLSTLPGDDVRQIMWRFANRYDLQMVVQSSRSVARGPVAHLVAEGGRNSHEWTEEKNNLLKVFDESGITALFMDTDFGGYIEGPKNLALALCAFELAWVDGGSATSSLAGNLALSPIHERGTPDQRRHYMSLSLPQNAAPGEEPWRGAFALTEPLPYVGVDTSMLCGRIRVVEMDSKLPDGPGENIPPEKQPIIQVDKRGRFITGMGFAKFVTAAVETDDPKIKSSCMIILEETDPGTFDRGIATKKLVHQLSSTNDPVFNLRVPASRIIGGYTIQNGQIVPNYTHGEVIEAVFRRTRITVGLMTTAKLLSAIEPVIRYQRQRFRGGASVHPGSPRHDLGLQQKEDSLHRLVDIWAAGEASASLGFAAARLFDDFDPLEKRKEEYCQKENLRGRNQLRALMKATPQALDYVKVCLDPNASQSKKDQLKNNVLVEFMAQEALASVLCPACKLWNTGHGANIMREAVSLMGGYGITEDCPGFLGNKWMDAQLEATYEGPEAVQRRQLSVTMTSEIFLTYYNVWINDLKKIHNERNNLGAEIVAKSMDLWRFTLNFLQNTKDATGNDLYHGTRQGVAFPMADALCWTLASHLQIMDTVELAEKGPQSPTLAEGLEGFVNFFSDLCQVQAIATAGKVTQTCNELVYGYINAKDPKLAQFDKLKSDLDHSLLGSRLAKDRAAQALTQVMIPEALDYPL